MWQVTRWTAAATVGVTLPRRSRSRSLGIERSRSIANTTDWVFGLASDPAVRQVTANVLDRFAGRR
jgi:hypothetical protein